MALKRGEAPIWRAFSESSSVVDLAGGFRSGKYSQEVRGGVIYSRETSGANWSVVEGNKAGDGLEITAVGESLKMVTYAPLLIAEYSRSYGNLQSVHFNANGLVAIARSKGKLEFGDMTIVSDLNEMMKGAIMTVVFMPDGRVLLLETDVDGRETTTSQVDSNLGESEVGRIAGIIENQWQSNLGMFNGEIGFDIYNNRIEFYYQKKNGKRLDVWRFARQSPYVCDFDEIVMKRMPTDEETVAFMEAISERVEE